MESCPNGHPLEVSTDKWDQRNCSVCRCLNIHKHPSYMLCGVCHFQKCTVCKEEPSISCSSYASSPEL
jgi:hypothetical protein